MFRSQSEIDVPDPGMVDLDEVVLCVDQSGSMAPSVVYASIFAAVLASLAVVRTKLVCFDTSILDLTDELADPAEVLFGVQLGGGTDINQAVAYCESRIERPTQSHLVLITDLFEGGDATELCTRSERRTQSYSSTATVQRAARRTTRSGWSERGSRSRAGVRSTRDSSRVG